MSIKNVIQDAYRALNDAGSVDGAAISTPHFLLRKSDDDVATTSSLTDALNVKNEKIRELQQQIQEAVSAELLAAMTDAVQCRDQYCLELKQIFGGHPASDETDVVAGHPEKPPRISVPAQHSSDEKEHLWTRVTRISTKPYLPKVLLRNRSRKRRRKSKTLKPRIWTSNRRTQIYLATYHPSVKTTRPREKIDFIQVLRSGSNVIAGEVSKRQTG